MMHSPSISNKPMIQCTLWSEWCHWSQRWWWGPRQQEAVRGGDSWPASWSLPSPRVTFLNLSSLVHILLSILERVVLLITEAVVEAMVADGRRQWAAEIPGTRADLCLRPEPPFLIYHHLSILCGVYPGACGAADHWGGVGGHGGRWQWVAEISGHCSEPCLRPEPSFLI